MITTMPGNIDQAPVAQRVDSTIHWINHYPLDNVNDFDSTYPLDSAIHPLNKWGQLAKPYELNCLFYGPITTECCFSEECRSTLNNC